MSVWTDEFSVEDYTTIRRAFGNAGFDKPTLMGQVDSALSELLWLRDHDIQSAIDLLKTEGYDRPTLFEQVDLAMHDFRTMRKQIEDEVTRAQRHYDDALLSAELAERRLIQFRASVSLEKAKAGR